MLIARRFFIAGMAMAMAASTSAFAQPLGEVETRANVEYGRHDGETLLGDAYMPRAPGKYPVIIAVHGGGWQGGSKSASSRPVGSSRRMRQDARVLPRFSSIRS